jgi:hypothetical protein
MEHRALPCAIALTPFGVEGNRKGVIPAEKHLISLKFKQILNIHPVADVLIRRF